ncbi:HlyD family type I secretion periplasmic adaptor subunit [Agrobacterium tumefaciens]|uniref:HlyD family type I secretion periplasmic adaptor subunit n=1 Tax=Agrobacterium tumefaciens TaxID=358 RepID=UPI0021D06124|nr:HlyD family type I secretion periplasmic adaptor subunit [Agrobacterium tumefaciens]UXT68567.1 HlyD family type I secretion periplasmic adaptor subunit [Agrobacterium tumefaciens]
MSTDVDKAARPPSPTARVTAWLMVILFTATVAGSYVAKIEIVARGFGKVIPSGRVQVVQPLTDGKIAKILVSEGESVKAGDVLVAMDTAVAESEMTRIKANIERHRQNAVIAKSIIAPLSEADPAHNGFIEAGRTAFLHLPVGDEQQRADAEALVLAVLSSLRDQVLQVDAQIDRVRKGQVAQSVKLETVRSDREIVASNFAAADVLRKHGTISEFDYRGRLRELKAIEGEATIAERQSDELVAEATVLVRQRTSLISTSLSTYRKQKNEAEIALQGLEAELRTANNHLQNQSLKAPMSGRVERLSVFTIGGFVEAGSTLMSIVPAGDDVEIEAFFDNRDIGFLGASQRAFVKFDAFPAERFGIVGGYVVNVGADARDDTTAGKWVYAVRLKLDQTSIRLPEREMKFVPGMTATIDVITGERRLITYFFEPIVKAIQDSFGER